MIVKTIKHNAIGLSGLMAFVLFAAPIANAHRTDYRDYDQTKELILDRVWEFNKLHPGFHIDSVRATAVVDFQLDGTVASASELRKPSKKTLSPREIFENCRKSSLIVGKIDHNPQLNQDRAYPFASAVALTADGICATNYHVVADLVLAAGLDHKQGMETLRFLMDYDGRIYPIEKVLFVDPLNDMALVKVSTVAGPLTPAAIGDDPAEGETVFCLSHPSGRFWNFTDGIVSNRMKKFDSRTGKTRYMLNISADYGVGASGGPIFDSKGNLVAIVSSTFSLYAQPQEFKNFQMAYKITVPAFLIKDCFEK